MIFHLHFFGDKNSNQGRKTASRTAQAFDDHFLFLHQSFLLHKGFCDRELDFFHFTLLDVALALQQLSKDLRT